MFSTRGCICYSRFLFTGHGVHDVFRATPIPRPMPQNEHATQYHLAKTPLLMSWYKTKLTELMEHEVSTHCWGSHRLWLCKQPFSTTKSLETTCLNGLYFNLPATVQSLGAQEFVELPQNSQALYLFDWTYLLTTAKGDFTMPKLKGGGNFCHPVGQSCLLKPCCKIRLQVPNAGITLTPDPLTCIQESIDIVQFSSSPLLRRKLNDWRYRRSYLSWIDRDVHQNFFYRT